MLTSGCRGQTGLHKTHKAALDARDGIRSITLEVSDSELAKRRKSWKPRGRDYNSGALWKYAQTVGTAEKGAVTHPGTKAETHVFADL